jgi:hypothetical protein
MMRDFASVGFQLSRARREMKVIYTGFLVLVGLGLCTNGLFQFIHIGPTVHRVATYYRGGTLGPAMVFPKTFIQLLELTHFHTFIMGVIFVILAHLLVATRLASAVKTALIGLAFAGSLGDVASYWLIRYLSPLFALLQLLSWVGMWLGYGGMIVVALWDMWRPERAGRG